MSSVTWRRLLISSVVGCILATLILIVFLAMDWSPGTEQSLGLSTAPDADSVMTEIAPTLSTGAASDSAAQVWLIVVTLIACLTALTAVVVAFYLYRWRRILLTGRPNALVPEEWGALLRDVSKSANNLIAMNDQNTRLLSEQMESHSISLQKMIETFMSFKQSLDEKDAEIERLRRGYDAHIYRKFLQRFIRVHQSLLECGAENDLSASDAKTLTLLLEDALEESGVAPFEPDIGEDFRILGERVADNPKFFETDDPKAHLTIAEINAPGYEVVGGELPVVLIPAQVTVYQSSKAVEEA